jgi:hypothetical protein
MIGVIYKWQPNNKINGSLFYAFEYYIMINTLKKTNFYIIDIPDNDLKLVKQAFKSKYTEAIYSYIDNLQSMRMVCLYKEPLLKSLFVDIHSYKSTRAFTRGIHYVFSNEAHDNYRSKSGTFYYGSYNYQIFDTRYYIKLNFDIFKKINTFGNNTFISFRNKNLFNMEEILTKYNITNPYIKSDKSVFDNLFLNINKVVYVHVLQDTNNRIIPEAFFYNIPVIIIELCNIVDSTILRFNDIQENGLNNYYLKNNDKLILDLVE